MTALFCLPSFCLSSSLPCEYQSQSYPKQDPQKFKAQRLVHILMFLFSMVCQLTHGQSTHSVRSNYRPSVYHRLAVGLNTGLQ